MAYHIRRTALPGPGDDGALTDLVGRIMAQRLDRDRPLWECWLIEGLSGGRWAVLTKVHHCVVDGVGGTQLYSAVFDDGASPAQHDDAPEPAPGPARLLVQAVGDLVTSPVEQVRLLLDVPALLAGRVSETAADSDSRSIGDSFHRRIRTGSFLVMSTRQGFRARRPPLRVGG